MAAGKRKREDGFLTGLCALMMLNKKLTEEEEAQILLISEQEVKKGILDTFLNTSDGPPKQVDHEGGYTSTYSTSSVDSANAINGGNYMNANRICKLDNSSNSMSRTSKWTPEEDALVLQLVNENGTKNWEFISQIMDRRTGKQCRERYFYHLDPTLIKTPLSLSEQKLLIKLQNEMGNKWAQISTFLSGRSDNSIKNYWNTAKRRVLRTKSAIDPPLHALLEDHLREVLIEEPQRKRKAAKEANTKE